ncbi:hypothetical protein JHK84_050397 [Glycine max]|nr:hypothetical protein JHK86_050337 [Glycine max]KAG5094809.1 hypothetical protein JHK84_050397 [Glycine max]
MNDAEDLLIKRAALMKKSIGVYFPERTATKVSEMLGNVNTSSALSAFEKMEKKAELKKKRTKPKRPSIKSLNSVRCSFTTRILDEDEALLSSIKARAPGATSYIDCIRKDKFGEEMKKKCTLDGVKAHDMVGTWRTKKRIRDHNSTKS